MRSRRSCRMEQTFGQQVQLLRLLFPCAARSQEVWITGLAALWWLHVDRHGHKQDITHRETVILHILVFVARCHGLISLRHLCELHKGCQIPWQVVLCLFVFLFCFVFSKQLQHEAVDKMQSLKIAVIIAENNIFTTLCQTYENPFHCFLRILLENKAKQNNKEKKYP